MINIITYILLAIVCFGYCHKSRPKRHFSSEEYRINTPSCDVVCEGQWKSEFHANFHKIYDTDYFEIPLDTAIVKNRASLKMFCSSTIQKYTCLRKECRILRTPWSAEKHICIGHFDNFDRNINCLSLTDRYVQKECSDVCNSIRIEISQAEISRMAEMEFSRQEKSEFIEQNKHCNFIACHQLCHEYIINKVCIDSAVSARSVVKSYYDSYLEREYTALNKDDQDELYSSFCRRVTPGQDENLYTANMTRYNNLTLDRMKNDIRSAFSILD
ncbi:hypothetical protein CAEBREN_30341 [Caenorhabditis brenneri]|uniref:DUF19 domain-containing protein n=1 Tax=Caenorhabditis brenneri TaxID=135651 RepID=G0N559_CAEBE|nr:hypothetical protein CAEBREN_30341 [Caenorhabditis brenneri]